MHGKAPTRDQKMILEREGMNHKDWLVLMNFPNTLVVKHRETGEIEVVEK